MNLIIAGNYDEMSEAAADWTERLLAGNPAPAIGLTTGHSPMGLYKRLAEKIQSGRLSLEQARLFCTEEYLGVGPEDARSLYAWLDRAFLAPVGASGEQRRRLAGESSEPQLRCEAFDREIEELGGLDLLIEGIGTNGHIGFNEPGTLPYWGTRIVALKEETLDYNYAYWNEQVPRYGMTIGLLTILTSKNILLLASGIHKAEALSKALQGPKTPDVPASYLQDLPQLTVIADQAAASMLSPLRKAGGR